MNLYDIKTKLNKKNNCPTTKFLITPFLIIKVIMITVNNYNLNVY